MSRGTREGMRYTWNSGGKPFPAPFAFLDHKKEGAKTRVDITHSTLCACASAWVGLGITSVGQMLFIDKT
jgi:hypothetical protein